MPGSMGQPKRQDEGRAKEVRRAKRSKEFGPRRWDLHLLSSSRLLHAARNI